MFKTTKDKIPKIHTKRSIWQLYFIIKNLIQTVLSMFLQISSFSGFCSILVPIRHIIRYSQCSRKSSWFFNLLCTFHYQGGLFQKNTIFKKRNIQISWIITRIYKWQNITRLPLQSKWQIAWELTTFIFFYQSSVCFRARFPPQQDTEGKEQHTEQLIKWFHSHTKSVMRNVVEMCPCKIQL